MNNIKILIVEDELIIADTIADSIERFGYEALEPVINYTSAIHAIEEHHPTLGIFDIKLSGKRSGIDLAQEVNKKYNIPFIFLTSNTDQLTLNNVKKVFPSAFLVKPFNTEELKAAIEIALYSIKQKSKQQNKIIKDSFFVKQKNGLQRVLFKDVLFIKSENVYLDFYLLDGKRLTVRGTKSEYEKKLPDFFLSTHRSYIVNLNYLLSINTSTVNIHGNEIPINKQQKDILLEIIKMD